MGFGFKDLVGAVASPMGAANLFGAKKLGLTGGAPDAQTSTQTNEPWSVLQPHLKSLYGGASDWYKSGDPTVAGLTPELQEAWGLASERARAGSPLMGEAQGAMGDILSGRSFDQGFNKQFDYAADRLGQKFQDITMPSIASAFSSAGRTGSGAQADMTSRAMGELGTSLSGLASDIYGQERGRQMQALGMAPAFAAQDYADIDRLASVGEGRRAFEQQKIDAPFTKLQNYGSLLTPGLGFGTQTSSQPVYKNPLGSALGGAAMGTSIMPGWGTAIGAGLGFLSGR